MNKDIVKPMPESAPAPATCRHEYSCGLIGDAEAHGERAEEQHSERLADHEAADDGDDQRPMADDDVRAERYAGVRKREHGQHQEARTWRDVAQGPGGRRLKPVMDSVKRAKRRQ